jgi:hypothetical protein
MPAKDALQIASADPAKPLGPEQKRFNNLIRQIKKARDTLLAWQEHAPRYASRHAQEQQPLMQELRAIHRERILALDAAYYRDAWTSRQSETLSDLIYEAASEMLRAGIDDAEIQSLFTKHSGVDFAAEQARSLREMKAMARDVYGMEVGGDDGIDSAEELLRRIQQHLAETPEDTAGTTQEAAPSAARKSAAQQRLETEAQQLAQSVREIFRKLASALHPDRETDADRRLVKTGLMQKVNQAYANDDLLALLELQLQIEQIDAGHIANADNRLVKTYNKVLAKQLAKLKEELAGFEMGFRQDFGLGDQALNPLDLEAEAGHQTRRLQSMRIRLRVEIDLLDNTVVTKRWLKDQRNRLDWEAAEPGRPLF